MPVQVLAGCSVAGVCLWIIKNRAVGGGIGKYLILLDYLRISEPIFQLRPFTPHLDL